MCDVWAHIAYDPSPYTVGLQFNKWQCIALTRSNAYVSFWIDGVVKAGPTRIPAAGAASTISIGTDPGWLTIGCTQVVYVRTRRDANDVYQRMKGRIAEYVIVKNVCLDMATVFPSMTKPTF